MTKTMHWNANKQKRRSEQTKMMTQTQNILHV